MIISLVIDLLLGAIAVWGFVNFVATKFGLLAELTYWESMAFYFWISLLYSAITLNFKYKNVGNGIAEGDEEDE